jgi:hypothetical protein
MKRAAAVPGCAQHPKPLRVTKHGISPARYIQKIFYEEIKREIYE